jgi:hypothetical protein
MPKHTGFFTKTFTQTIAAVELMASHEGTTIAELTKKLSLTRRSVFRLLSTIEHDLNIPVIINRKVFGGVSTYRLQPELVEKFSHTTTPSLALSFRQAILFYLIFKDEVFMNNNETQDNLKFDVLFMNIKLRDRFYKKVVRVFDRIATLNRSINYDSRLTKGRVQRLLNVCIPICICILSPCFHNMVLL